MTEFKKGMKVVCIDTTYEYQKDETAKIAYLPGSKWYDSQGFWNSAEGMVVRGTHSGCGKKLYWTHQKNWKVVQP